MDCSPPGSSVHGVFQARILACVAIASSRGSSQPKDQTPVSCNSIWVLYCWTTREPLGYFNKSYLKEGKGLPGWHSGKESICQCKRHRRHRFNPCVKKFLWRRKWQSSPVFLPGKFHGQRNLAGYSLWGLKSQTWLKRLSTHTAYSGMFY